jgi:hypothetical protein
MKNLFIVLAIVVFPTVSFAKNINGTWILPPKSGEKVEVTIVSKSKRAIAIVSIVTDCNKPIYAPLDGTAKRVKGEHRLSLISPKILLPEKCSLILFMNINAKLVKFPKMLDVTKGKMTGIVSCPKKRPTVTTDDIGGKWLPKVNKSKKPATKTIHI